MNEEVLSRLPGPIQDRLRQVESQSGQIIDSAAALLTTPPLLGVRLRFQHDMPTEILTPYERAQAVSFVTRLDVIPTRCTVEIKKDGDKFRIGNIGVLRSALNEWRPIIELEKDPCHYRKIHNAWFPKLGRTSPLDGLRVSVVEDNGADRTSGFKSILAERHRAITTVLRALDYDYLYNGILQHSDARYSEKYLADYISGNLNYVLWKHVNVLGFIFEMLRPIHQLVNQVAFPTPGPL